MDEKDIDKKLDKIDEKFNVESIRKYYKARLLKRINKGEVGLIDELEKLEKLEAGELPSKPSHSKSEDKGSADEDEVGVPHKLRFKRSYTLTDKALEARQKNSEKSTGPRTEDGKKASSQNSWKHGQFARNYILHKVKPCKSTCPQYPCSLVEDNTTQPGGQCLDKAAVLQFYAAISEAVQNKNYDAFNDLAAFTMSEQMHILHLFMEDLQRDGTMLKRFKYDKFGNEIGYEVVPHPSSLSFIKLADVLGVKPNEMMLTPKALAKQEDDDEGTKTIADLISSIGKGMKKKNDKDDGE